MQPNTELSNSRSIYFNTWFTLSSRQKISLVSDNIENNVEEAVVEVKEGNEKLVKAEEHQRSANKKKICIAATIAIIVIVIVIIIIVKNT